MFKPAKWVLLLESLVFILIVGCNMPRKVESTEPPVSYIRTAAAETIQAQITNISGDPVTAYTPPIQTAIPSNPTQTIETIITHTPPLATTQSPSTPAPCNVAKFVKDVTVPDNTKLKPEESFVKTWRLRNAGSCTWTAGYALIFEGDNILNAPASVQLTTGSVVPGQEIDVSVNLQAPSIGGIYRQYFKLIDEKGNHFGLGNGEKPFWVQIKVVLPSGITFDFLSTADQADWKSGIGNDLTIDLSFDGDDNDTKGVAKIKDNQTLENNTISGKVLLTFPKHELNGVIASFYPVYLVQPGDHFKARLGFIANPDGSCHAGKVKFQIGYKKDGKIYVLKEIKKSCNGSLQSVNIDLTSLKGQTIQFFLAVKANGDFTDDWAIWSSPRIER